MIAHVAAAGEQRGRVVLRLTQEPAHPMALEAAMRMAQAFQSEVESVFVEDLQLFEWAAFPFACEISLTGRRRIMITPERLALDLQHTAAALQRRVGDLARLFEIPFHSTVIRDEPVNAIARACAEHGPWNVVVLAEPLAAAGTVMLRELFAAVSGATGILVVGPNARHTTGPVIAEVDDIDHLEPILRTAEKLLGTTTEERLILLLAGHSESETLEMEGQARLILRETPVATIARVVVRDGAPIELAERLRREGSGFVLARFGGLLAPDHGDLHHLVQSLECPLLLMR